MTQSDGAEPFSGLRALVVEDEFLIAIDVQRILESAGAGEVVLAARVSDALAALQAPGIFDVAVLDIMLGSESSQRVAADLTARGVPFVYGSGMDSPASPPYGPEQVPHVPKPYSEKALLAALAKVLAKR